MEYPNLFLIGFMGSGKTHWGKIWSEKFRLSFLDLDQEIEKEMGMTVEGIFEKYGEEKFRELEKQHLRNLKGKKNILVSCGGGVPCFSDNMDWMLENGIVIYLKAGPLYLLERVINETDRRPLLKRLGKSEVLLFIENKLKEREPFYRRAHYIFDMDNIDDESPGRILDELIPKMKQEKNHNQKPDNA